MKFETLPQEFLQAREIIERLQEAGFEAYFVGGSVRDALLGRTIHDVDIATSAYPAEVKSIFSRTIDVGIEHGTVLVLTKSGDYEVTTFRTESTYTDFRRPDHVDFVRELREDLKRRDFTINALACNLSGEIIDLFDGLLDLKKRQIRAVGEARARFNEDALRIMRALRFSATLGFEIEAATAVAMADRAPLLTKISIERIFIELDKLLLADGWQAALRQLTESGAWRYLPDFEAVSVAKISADFRFENSAQAWAWLSLQLTQLNLRKWKLSNAQIKAIEKIHAAYKLENYQLSDVYQLGLHACTLADALKKAQNSPVSRSKPAALDRQLQIHAPSELAIKGADLIVLGFEPGPKLGQLLKKIEHKIVMNTLKNTKKEILDYVKTQG